MTTFKLGLPIPKMYLYVKLELKVYNCWGEQMTKFKLGLPIPKMYLYVKLEMKVYNCWGENERKSRLSSFFRSSRGIALSELIKHDKQDQQGKPAILLKGTKFSILESAGRVRKIMQH
jgi:hypothetical protein